MLPKEVEPVGMHGKAQLIKLLEKEFLLDNKLRFWLWLGICQEGIVQGGYYFPEVLFP